MINILFEKDGTEILMMMDCGDRVRTLEELCNIFNDFLKEILCHDQRLLKYCNVLIQLGSYKTGIPWAATNEDIIKNWGYIVVYVQFFKKFASFTKLHALTVHRKEILWLQLSTEISEKFLCCLHRSRTKTEWKNEFKKQLMFYTFFYNN